MAGSNTPRRVLKDLSVNTFGSPNASSDFHSNNVSLKRQIHEVDEPTLPPSSNRPRASDRAQPSSIKVRSSRMDIEPLIDEQSCSAMRKYTK